MRFGFVLEPNAMEQVLVKDRLRLLLDHFGAVGDPREACKVKYPLREVLFLVTCASIAAAMIMTRSPIGASIILAS